MLLTNIVLSHVAPRQDNKSVLVQQMPRSRRQSLFPLREWLYVEMDTRSRQAGSGSAELLTRNGSTDERKTWLCLTARASWQGSASGRIAAPYLLYGVTPAGPAHDDPRRLAQILVCGVDPRYLIKRLRGTLRVLPLLPRDVLHFTR
jgi:hypothetical protein